MKKQEFNNFFLGGGGRRGEGAKMICYVALDIWRENK